MVGHSYIVYAPLLAGMATIVYEGLPTWPDCGVWWKIVEKYQVSRMFSAPTAIRVLKKFPTAEIRKHDLSSLEVLYLAGEPLDEPTASWVSNTLDVPVIDNYWQTESGWPIMAIARGLTTGRRVWEAPVCRCMAITCSCLMKSPANRVASTRKGCWWWKGRCRRVYSDHLGRRRPLCEDLLVAVFPPGVRHL